MWYQVISLSCLGGVEVFSRHVHQSLGGVEVLSRHFYAVQTLYVLKHLLSSHGGVDALASHVLLCVGWNLHMVRHFPACLGRS